MRYSLSWVNTAFSINVDKNLRLETGRKLEQRESREIVMIGVDLF